MPPGLKRQSTGDSIRCPCSQLMQSHSVNPATVLYSMMLLIAAAFGKALLKRKELKGRMASLRLTCKDDRPYHLFAILTARTLCDYFLKKAESFKTLLPLITPHNHHHGTFPANRPVESSNYGQDIKVGFYYSGQLFKPTQCPGDFGGGGRQLHLFFIIHRLIKLLKR